MLAATLAAHAEALARQPVTPKRQRLLVDIIDIHQGVFHHIHKIGNARRVAEHLHKGRQRFRLLPRGAHHHLVPLPQYLHFRVEGLQQALEIGMQLFDELLANRTAFDGDFGEKLDDKLHDSPDLADMRRKRR